MLRPVLFTTNTYDLLPQKSTKTQSQHTQPIEKNKYPVCVKPNHWWLEYLNFFLGKCNDRSMTLVTFLLELKTSSDSA